jgi:hypothetical protein
MARLMDSIEGILGQKSELGRGDRVGEEGDRQDGLETLFVHRHLDGDVGEVVVDELIRGWRDGGVVRRVLVVVSDGTDAGWSERTKGT